MILPPDEAALASLSSLDDRVRGALYAYVSGCTEPVGRDEAAAAVGIGRALAVYHLDKLVEAGLLAATYRRPPGRSGPGAGRPAKLYSRSGREFAVRVPPREYELAARLLVQAVSSDRSGRSQTALDAAGCRLGAQLAAGGQAGQAGHEDPRRALRAVLREHGFEPYEATGGTIRLRNCPFLRLAEQDPGIVCGMNLALITGMVTGIGAAGGLRPALDPRPGQCCVAIHQRNTEDERHGAEPGS